MKTALTKKFFALLIIGAIITIFGVTELIKNIFANLFITGFVTNNNFFSNLLVPTAVTSIVFSILGLITLLLLINEVRERGVRRTFPIMGYLIALGILVTIFAINYYITLFPYGNIALNVISFALQILIYGILLPYVFVAQLAYIILLLKGEVNKI